MNEEVELSKLPIRQLTRSSDARLWRSFSKLPIRQLTHADRPRYG